MRQLVDSADPFCLHCLVLQLVDILGCELLRPARPASYHDLKGQVQQALHCAQFRVHELDIFVEELVRHARGQLVRMAICSKRPSGLVELLRQALRSKLGDQASEHQGEGKGGGLGGEWRVR